MNFVVPDFAPAATELFMAGMSLVILLLTVFMRQSARNVGYMLTQVTLIGAALITIFMMDGQVRLTMSDMYVDDLLGDVLKVLILFSVITALIYGRAYAADRGFDTPEYHLLALFSTLGMMVMVSSSHFLSMYVGLEMLSLSLYAMVALDRDSARSTEAAMKYFILGALASGMLLYGMSMVYGATGNLSLAGIDQAIYNQAAVYDGVSSKTVLTFGLVFIVAGLAFKFGAAPFHMWVPDVYHGAPTSVTLLIGSAPKLAAFAMAIRLLVGGMLDLAEHWQTMLMLMAIASLVLGNIAAIAQTNLKRMLAYSGISHMGFVFLGLLTGVVDGDRFNALNAYTSSMFYAIAYVVMSLASFGMIILLSRSGFEAENIDDLKGLNKRSSWFAAMMMIVMFSMAGIPFFVGFFAKMSILQSLVAADMVWLAVFAVMMSLIGAFYYLRVVKVMYFDEPVDTAPIHSAPDVRVLLSVNCLAIAALGLLPQQMIDLCQLALVASFPG
ncbi:MAG: NADH-quinone oxidoreductase subunit NuoN [Rhodocyclaceae bacterium]|nr:NADH-quinone oxidoreductase subunit NuoN [Rhodocyclaceae bacterium]MCB1963980.1 NADH-quinone oxidoreductase subunit NuoN [Rhodocyclaceae bacterium]